MSLNKKPTAQWSISLYVDCPCCGDTVDLCDSPGFWDEIKEPAKTGDADVICPECDEAFTVEMEF